MGPVQPSAFCGVLIKPPPHCSFQRETYVQGLAEVWDSNFNGTGPYGLPREVGQGRRCGEVFPKPNNLGEL